MNDVSPKSADDQARKPAEARDALGDDGGHETAFVNAVTAAIEAQNAHAAQALVDDLHGGDLADLLELLDHEQRQGLVTLLGRNIDYTALSELDEAVRDDVLEVMAPETVAEAVQELPSDDAVFLLEDLDDAQRTEILDQVPAADRRAIDRALDYPEDSAGRLMQTELVAVPVYWTVGQVIDYARQTDDLPVNFFEIFVVDETYHLKGTMPLSRLLRTKRNVLIEQVMDKEQTLIPADMDQEEAAYKFQQYNLLSAAVVDENDRLAGVITIDDIVDVVQEEAAEDIGRLGGVGQESLADTVIRTTQRRFAWLLINLITAVIASIVIGMFGATIERMVALAVLMPIVASMGGNAATQTMTVAVRALATRDLVPFNLRRIINREALVGVANGVLFAVIVGAVAYVWFGSAALGLVISAAMVVNMFVAGLCGILIPVALDRMAIDPAVASGVFVTTVTDVIGFLAFLGLAALWLV